MDQMVQSIQIGDYVVLWSTWMDHEVSPLGVECTMSCAPVSVVEDFPVIILQRCIAANRAIFFIYKICFWARSYMLI